MPKAYTSQAVLSKKWYSKLFLSLKWLVVMAVFAVPFFTSDNSFTKNFLNALVYYFLLSFFWLIVESLICRKEGKETKKIRDRYDYD